MFAQRTLILATSGVAALIVFVATGLVDWPSAIPMLLGAVIGGWIGARLGLLLSADLVRVWTLIVSVATPLVFFWRPYGCVCCPRRHRPPPPPPPPSRKNS